MTQLDAVRQSSADTLHCQRCGWVAEAGGPGLVSHWDEHGGIPETVIRYVLPLGLEASVPRDYKSWRRGRVA